MNSKRYKVYSDSYSADIVDEETGQNYNQITDMEDICDLLNNQYEMIERVKKVMKEHYNNSKKDYERAVKGGMPSSILYDEMSQIEDIMNEIGLELIEE